MVIEINTNRIRFKKMNTLTSSTYAIMKQDITDTPRINTEYLSIYVCYIHISCGGVLKIRFNSLYPFLNCLALLKCENDMSYALVIR